MNTSTHSKQTATGVLGPQTSSCFANFHQAAMSDLGKQTLDSRRPQTDTVLMAPTASAQFGRSTARAVPPKGHCWGYKNQGGDILLVFLIPPQTLPCANGHGCLQGMPIA